MTDTVVKKSVSFEKLQAAGGSGGGGEGQFKVTGSAAEMAMMQAEGYAEEGLAEHKEGQRLGNHWRKKEGYGSLRAEGEDYEEAQQRLRELQEKRRAGMGYVQRAREAVGGAVAAVAGAVMPGRFKASRSAAELAYGEAEGYAEPGTAEHKAAGGKHLEEHWHKGAGGLRPEGEDVEEEQARLRELQERQAGQGIVQRAKEAVTSTAAAATEKASGVLHAAKEMVGLEPKK